MAHHRAAQKALRQSRRQRLRNRRVKSTVATCVKQARQEIANKKSQPMGGGVKQAVSLLARAAAKGVMVKKTASRRISRLMHQAHRASSTS
ncbi:MAG: 30S ribosomal protein S20 [Myxococcota bacterium]